jgi:hypothetical protein
MSFITPFGKRKIYLINHDPINHARQLEDMGMSFSKFLSLQTVNEFRDAVYNDFVAGELFSSEEAVKQRLYPDEYYLELLASVEAISHTLPDGHVFIKSGFVPKILALKTADNAVYKYNDMTGFQEESPKMPLHTRKVYNYNPDRWSLFIPGSRSHVHHDKSLIEDN